MSVVGETGPALAAILGYARVSTSGQDLDAQRTVLAAAGIKDDRIYTDKPSGAANTARPGLAASSTTPAMATPSESPHSTASVDLSPKSPAPSPNSAKGESYCTPYARGSTPTLRPAGQWPPSWPPSPTSKSN